MYRNTDIMIARGALINLNLFSQLIDASTQQWDIHRNIYEIVNMVIWKLFRVVNYSI